MIDWNHYREELLGRIGDLGRLNPPTVRGYRQLGEARERFVQRDQRVRPLQHRDLDRVQVHALLVTPALSRPLPPRVVDEDLTHRARRERKEVAAVLPVHAPGVHQLDVGLVHERGGRHGRSLRAASQVRVRDLAQPLVDDGEEPVERRGAAGPALQEKLRYARVGSFRRGDDRIRHAAAYLIAERKG